MNADSTDQVTNKWRSGVFSEFDSAVKYLQQDTIPPDDSYYKLSALYNISNY